MKNIILSLFALSLSSLAFSAPLTVKFTNTANTPGKILVSVFNDARYFPDVAANAVVNKKIVVTKKDSEIEVKLDLPVGEYAIASFLDENGDEKLNTGFMGIPKERFGFSNNPSILTGAPGFGAASFNVVEGQNKITIKLKSL
jgi:uncharacterized protein (DUF2141 family)